MGGTLDNFTKIFTIATGIAMVGLVLYNGDAAVKIIGAASSGLNNYIGTARGERAERAK